MEVGLMGYGGGFVYEAEVLFQKLRIADPTAAYPLLGLALMSVFSRKPLEVEQLLLELELGPHSMDPVVRDWIQDIRKMGIEYARASAGESQKNSIR